MTKTEVLAMVANDIAGKDTPDGWDRAVNAHMVSMTKKTSSTRTDIQYNTFAKKVKYTYTNSAGKITTDVWNYE